MKLTNAINGRIVRGWPHIRATRGSTSGHFELIAGRTHLIPATRHRPEDRDDHAGQERIAQRVRHQGHADEDPTVDAPLPLAPMAAHPQRSLPQVNRVHILGARDRWLLRQRQNALLHLQVSAAERHSREGNCRPR